MKIDRLFRTRIRIHYTWILAFVLISWTVSTHFSTETSLFSRFAFGLVASILYFLVILLRELVLLILATYKGVVVKRITIFAFGGLLQVEQETTTPSHELLLAVAGILCNLMIAGILYLSYILWGRTDHIVIDMLLKWLAFLYFILSLFHVIPAFPLDGGRILHAILWETLNNTQKAMRIAGWIGWAIGLIITVGGIAILIYAVEKFTGGFLASVGLILQNAATHSLRQLKSGKSEKKTQV